MNGLLQLKGRFEKRGNEGMGPIGLPANKKVTSEHIEELISQLFKVKEYWADKDDIAGLIVSVHYIRVVAKSNRLKTLLADVGKKPVDSIRGAKFVTGTDDTGKHNVDYQGSMSDFLMVVVLDKTENEYSPAKYAQGIFALTYQELVENLDDLVNIAEPALQTALFDASTRSSIREPVYLRTN